MKLVIYFTAQALASLVIFGLFAFVLWEINPANWPQEVRLCLAALWPAALWLASVCVATANGDIA